MNAREYALDVLYRVFHEHGFASLILRNSPLSEKDTAFAANLIYGTIRNRSLLEAQWRPYTKGRVRPKTAVLLDLTVFQLFFTDGIPAYAAVSAGVDLAKKQEKKFVNAILRTVQKNGLSVPAGDTAETLAVRYSHPEWIVRMWIRQYGSQQALQILAQDQKEHPVYGRINTLREESGLRESEGITMLEDDCFRYAGVLSRSQLFRSGQVLIQDRSSQRVVRELDVQPGMRVLDLCAAPGTKTQQTACLMRNEGSITACDLYEQRCSLIDALMEKTGVTIVETMANDASKTRFAPESYDRILCDVPCSGLGDLSHKPEIRWHLEPADVDAIIALQAEILDANADALKHGGILVYSTCTLNCRENEGQVRAFLKRHPDYDCLREETLFPDRLDADGFYMAKLRRK